jgi:sugar phosphate isomerase/epimerase
LEGRPWREVVRLTGRNIRDIADIGKRHGIQFQLEPIAWSPIHSLSQSLEVIEEAGRDNVGMVIDFWHLWAGEATTPDDVAKLKGSMIHGVHFCDGVRHIKGTPWVETDLRGYLPGEGKIPIPEWTAAVKATGFDGVWSCELLSPRHWEWDLVEIARKTKALMEQYIR